MHDRLELAGWQVEIADAQKVKGLAPLACKTDRIDAWVLTELSRRELVPAIWLPDPLVRAERERARWVLAYTIAAELGDINRFPTPRKLAGYTGHCPRVYQSGERDLRGPLAKQGPRSLRWALVEAATHACTAPAYRDRYQQTKARIGKQRGAKVAQIDLARRLTEAITKLGRHARATLALTVASLVVLVAAATAATSTSKSAQTPKPTIVLVHGGWDNSTGWNGVIQRLQRKGYTAIAAANPLRGLKNDAAYVSSLLESISGPIVLVGHS